MPATHYIISVQVALLAASAAYLKSDRGGSLIMKDPVKISRPTTAHAGYVDESEEEELMTEDVLRGALAFQSGAEAPPELAARAMGFRPGANGRARLPAPGEEGVPEAARKQATPSAVPVKGVEAASGAQLSAVAAEEVRFDPVPDGQGYSITADTASHFDLATKTVVFAGNVSLHCEDFELTSDRLVVYMESEGGSMDRMIANGNVDVKLLQGSVTERYHGMGEEADFLPSAQKIVFRGWPRILGHGREHRAASATTKMTLFTKPARLETEGRAQTRILRGEDGTMPGFAAQ